MAENTIIPVQNILYGVRKRVYFPFLSFLTPGAAARGEQQSGSEGIVLQQWQPWSRIYLFLASDVVFMGTVCKGRLISAADKCAPVVTLPVCIFCSGKASRSPPPPRILRQQDVTGGLSYRSRTAEGRVGSGGELLERIRQYKKETSVRAEVRLQGRVN